MVRLQALQPQSTEEEIVEYAAGLLSQQIWCWGRDILRPEGNWLLKIAFDRIAPPADRQDCSSVYSKNLPRGQYVVLRGFGVFFGDHQRGGVFLPRYEFRPKFTTQSTLTRPPWSDADLPELHVPMESELSCCASLTLNLIDWIRSYEVRILDQLGIEYRRTALSKWDNGKRPVILPDEMAEAWQSLGVAFGENFRALLPQHQVGARQAS